MLKHFEISRFFMLLFLPAAIWLISNNYINRHYHILEDGKVISHSHPHNNSSQSPIQDHDHSDFEYSVLAQVSSNSNSENAESFSVEFFLCQTGNSLKPFYQFIKYANPFQLPGLRAPPAA